MYTLLISTAIAIYTLVLVDVSILYKELSVNNDSLSSTQALYTAEGAIEKTIANMGSNHLSLSNKVFLNESNDREQNTQSEFIEYNKGVIAFYNKRRMSLNQPFLHSLEKINSTQSAKNIRLAKKDTSASRQAFYGLEAQASQSFSIREVSIENDFNEIEFQWNQNSQNAEVSFEIIIFPKEGESIELPSFEELKNNPEKNPFKRIIINSSDKKAASFAFNDQIPLTIKLDTNPKDYKRSLNIIGFKPLENNYLLRFQTLSNQAIHYQINALHQGEKIVLPNLMQNIDLIA